MKRREPVGDKGGPRAPGRPSIYGVRMRPVAVSLNPAQKAKVESLAGARGVSLAAAIRLMIDAVRLE